MDKVIIIKVKTLEEMLKKYEADPNDTYIELSFKSGASDVISQILIFGKGGAL